MIPGLDIIVRLEDASDLPQIERLLFTVLGQRTQLPLTLRLMLARFSDAAVDALRQQVEALRHLDPATAILFHNWQQPAPFDLRVALLNWALDVSPGRYVMVLEPSDLLFPDAVERLFQRLSTSHCALAVGGMRQEQVIWWGDVFLQTGARSATASTVFLLDRTMVPPRDAVFRLSPDGQEIRDFVAAIGAGHAIDRAELDRAIGVRQIPV